MMLEKTNKPNGNIMSSVIASLNLLNVIDKKTRERIKKKKIHSDEN